MPRFPSCTVSLRRSHVVSVVWKALLGLDLAIVLDGDLVVGLECGDSVVGNLGAVDGVRQHTKAT
jgi:hypothetical protein